MGKTATGGGEPRELIPARTYRAVVCGVYDIGTQKGYGDRGPTPKFVLEYELHTRKGPAFDAKGHPLTICQFVSFYLGSTDRKSDLLKVVEAACGRGLSPDEIRRGYDAEDLVGKAVQVQVVHDDKGQGARAKVGAVMPLDPDDDPPEAQLDHHYFEIRADAKGRAIDEALPEWLPRFVADFARKSREFGGDVAGAAASGARQPALAGAALDPDDPDVPF